MSPKPPNARRAPAKPWHASAIRTRDMEVSDMATMKQRRAARRNVEKAAAAAKPAARRPEPQVAAVSQGGAALWRASYAAICGS
jgi:hypothetical protein